MTSPINTITDMARQYKAALVYATKVAVADPKVQVCYGAPGKHQADDILSWGRLEVVFTNGPISPKRLQDLVLTCTLTASVLRKGGPEAEQKAADRAYDLLVAVEQYVRITDTQLAQARQDGVSGPLVWWCMPANHVSEGATDPLVISKGRIIEIECDFVAHARIGN